MRGSKAKRLRKLGLKSGPAPSPETDEHSDQMNNAYARLLRAECARKRVHCQETLPVDAEGRVIAAAAAKRERRRQRNLTNVG